MCKFTDRQAQLLCPKSITHVSPSMGKLPTCWQQVAAIEFGKRDTTDFCPRQLVRLVGSCCGLATGKLM